MVEGWSLGVGFMAVLGMTVLFPAMLSVAVGVFAALPRSDR